MLRFEHLPDETQAQVARAIADFFRCHGYVHVLDACERLGLTPQELWGQIMRRAGLPSCDVRSVLEVE